MVAVNKGFGNGCTSTGGFVAGTLTSGVAAGTSTGGLRLWRPCSGLHLWNVCKQVGVYHFLLLCRMRGGARYWMAELIFAALSSMYLNERTHHC